MDRLEAIKTMQSKKPQTSTRLLRAIKALGKTKEEITETLITLGFSKFNQTEPTSCPVCAYLLSLGFKSPYVFTDSIRCAEGASVSLWDVPTEMGEFQEKASAGALSSFAGFKSV